MLMSAEAESLLTPLSASDHLACESLVGRSVGDALGAQFEGARFERGKLDATLETDSPARWTDDTQMAHSVVEVLLIAGTVDQDRLETAFASRYQPLRGYGPATHVLLSSLKEGKTWRDLNLEIVPGGSFGNGSSMRVAPLVAYFHEAAIDVVVAEAERSAQVTHAHIEGRAGAAATAVASWLAARSRRRAVAPPAELFSVVRSALDPSLRVYQGVEAASNLPSTADLEEAVEKLGNGSNVATFDTVPLALWIAFRRLDDYETAIREAIACGGDADTIAAIVGGIVAARVGIGSIPEKWRSAVEPLPIQF
jgi:ADP-ribosylglycohydrolase